MEGVNNNDDDRAYRVNLNNEGETKLKESVTDKLKEFMGDYTDDTLVEYVIVLLRNGRRKEEARNELNVFLGDDTDSFVTWLWDHLSMNLHFYVPQQESFPDEAAETKSVLEEEAGGKNSLQLDESEREMTVKEPKSRRNREWKGLVRDVAEPPSLRSSEFEYPQLEKKYHKKHPRVKRPHSPQPPSRITRSRYDEQEQNRQREALSNQSIGAPRRLLQFAMRDALGSLRSPSSKVNTTLKRLRSVVSTSTGNSSVIDHPQRIRSVASLPSAVTTLYKAAAEAAEDVTKVRGSANVFDRLGRGHLVSGVTNYSSEVKATPIEDAEYEDFDVNVAEAQSVHPKINEHLEEFDGNTAMLDRDIGTAYNSASDNEGYDNVNVGHQVMNASQTGTSFTNKDDDSFMVQYSVANNTNEIGRKRVKDQNPTATGATTSRKIVNISVNVNTWKPPHYQAAQEVKEFKNLDGVQNSDTGAIKPGVRLLKENNKPVVPVNEIERGDARIQNESQKTLLSTPGAYSFGRPTEDADSQTVFINNVHFAATKDTLSRHFNKFGEVLKVVIVTDSATGQPTGSAYIEFMRKEAAELALSLNGTSFMSRILKVVRKSSAYMESSNVVAWPRISRASAFAARHARVPFPRGMPAAFRTRLPVKPGARSLQWKRDASTTPVSEGNMNGFTGASSNSVPSPTGRSLTYVRKDT